MHFLFAIGMLDKSSMFGANINSPIQKWVRNEWARGKNAFRELHLVPVF